MDNFYFRIYGHKQLGVAEAGAVVEMTLGCDGKKHAGMISKIYYTQSGELEFAENLGTVDRGACKHNRECKDLGFFSSQSFAQT
jgi:hypothetical protein